MNVALLERATGNAGIDARLVGEITTRAHVALRRLGLDSNDTTEEELYYVLVAAYNKDSMKLREILRDTYFVLVNLGIRPMSLNFNDIEETVLSGVPYQDSSVAHAQRQLRAELIRRYAEHERTHEDMVYRLGKEVNVLAEEDNFEPLREPLVFKKTARHIKNNKDANKKPDDNGRPIAQHLRLSHHASDARQFHSSTGGARAEVDRTIDIAEKENSMDKSPQILAIGDINTNAFIKLNEDSVGQTTDKDGYDLVTLELGAKLPYDGVDVIKVNECSPNASVSLSRLGLDAHLMTWVGGDDVGQEMIDYLKEERVGVSNIVIERDQKSNYHYVLRYGADRTKLQRFEDFSYQWKDPDVVPDWIYLGVLGEKTWSLHESILAYLKTHPSIKLVFQPGMYHLMWGAEKLREFYQHAEIVIMNREEAAQVTGKTRDSVEGLLSGLHELGVTVAVVTDGPTGAFASDGTKQLYMPNFPDPAAPFERTGAGDAFASTIVAALALGETLETALLWAPINSAYVVQKMGAQAGLLTRDVLLQHLADAPEWYHPQPLTEYLSSDAK